MHNMDLIPEDYRKEIAIRRMLINFILAILVVLSIIGVTKATLSFLIWRENKNLSSIEKLEKDSQLNKNKFEEYKKQKQIVEQQLAGLNELRGNVRIKGFLYAIDNSYTEGVWFKRLRFMRQSITTMPDKEASITNVGVISARTDAYNSQLPEIKHGVEIIGYAINHSVLAEFMRKLSTERSIAEFNLIDTSIGNHKSIEVIDFKIAIQIK